MNDVFISYSRRNKDFVKTLYDHLTEKQREAWVDWEDIPLTADWMQEIRENFQATASVSRDNGSTWSAVELGQRRRPS